MFVFGSRKDTVTHHYSFFFDHCSFFLVYIYADVCCTLYTSHLMFVHLGGLMDSNGMFNQKSCFHLYRCRVLICHTHVAPKFSHAQTRKQPWTGTSGWPHSSAHTPTHTRPKTEWVQLLLINKWAALLADATVAIDSELAVQARGLFV